MLLYVHVVERRLMGLTDDPIRGDYLDVLRYYRSEVVNNVGYILATLIVAVGIFGFDFFRGLMGPGRLFGPVVLGALACLMAYFASRLMYLTRDPRVLVLSVARGDD
jgi:hypothetical protein